MRPPSLEPSTPDVREPREWTTQLGYRLAALERGKDGVDRGVVAQPPGVQDHVVVRRVVPVVAVDLLDVGGPVLVRLLEAAPRLVFGADVVAGHDRLHPTRLRRPQEQVEGARELGQDVGTAPADDHDVPGSGRLLDDVLGDLQDGLPGVEGRPGVGRRPGGRFGRDQRLAAGRAERDEQPGQERTGMLILSFDLFARQLEPAPDLVDDLGIQEVGLQRLGQHVADGRAPRPKLPPDRDDRHGSYCPPSPRRGEGRGEGRSQEQGEEGPVKTVGARLGRREYLTMRRDPFMARRAKELRANQNSAEARIWSMLRAGRLAGLKFRRQHVLGRYVADFVCIPARLVIEIDGDTHDEAAQLRDAKRTDDIEQAGYRVIRFWNNYVLNDKDGGVAEVILEAVRTSSLPEPEKQRLVAEGFF